MRIPEPSAPLPSQAKQRFTRGLIILVFIALLCASTLASLLTARVIMAQQRSQFDSQTQQMTTFIQSRLDGYAEISSGLQGLFAASQSVEADEWDAYVGKLNVSEKYAGISSIRFVKRVAKADVKAYPYAIHPLADKLDYFPTTYVSDFVISTSTTSSLGLDISSEENRRAALARAASSGSVVATPIVPGISNGIPVFSFYAPVYRNGMPINTGDERVSALAGFVNLGFRVKNLFETIFVSPLFGQGVAVTLYDTPDIRKSAPDTLIYGNQAIDPSTDPALTDMTPIRVADRTWTVRYVAERHFGLTRVDRFAPLAVLLAGLLASILISWVLHSYARSREVAVVYAEKLTADLQNAKAKDEAMLLGIGDGVIATDEQGKIILANAAFERLLGWTEREAVGRSMAALIPLLDKEGKPVPIARRPLTLAFAGTISLTTTDTFYYVARDGHTFPVAITISPVVLDGRRVGVVEVFRDISREKDVDRAKSEFVSLASHQLRTPPTIINYYADMLLAGDAGQLSPQQHEFVQEIGDAGKRMVELVHALLNTTRVDLGTLTIRPESLDVRELAAAAIKELREDIARKRIVTHVDAPADLPHIMADPGVLFLVFQNLVSNAVRYTPEDGLVRVSFTVSGVDMHMQVADSGLGIPAEAQPHIFTKLYRADNARKYVAQGTGLGLYLVKSILDKTGGSVRFESAEGKGTTFFVTMPLTGMAPKEGSTQLA